MNKLSYPKLFQLLQRRSMNKIPYIKPVAIWIGFTLIGAGKDNILVGLGLGLIMAILLSIFED